jgi:hypothetical protein
MALHDRRLDAYHYLSQSTALLHSYFMAPTPERFAALKASLDQYAAEVTAGTVTAPRIWL